jgi:tRNA threonylcarbamoyladenosine biosynthesis protein TsaE
VIELRTGSVAETQALAAVVAEHVRPGDLIVLAGDLGSGKTAFVQGLAAALGVVEVVTSPTFTLTHSYAGRLPVHHVDVYRLERMAEVEDLGLGELIDGKGVTLVEWGDVVVAALPASFLEVRLAFHPFEENARTLAVRAVGPPWQGRFSALATNLQRWRC